jgi:hypothetical protein
MAGIGKMVANAVRSAAYMAGEIEENSINEVVRDATVSQLNELAKDVKMLVEGAKESIDNHLQMKAAAFNDSSITTTTAGGNEINQGRRTYAEALVNPPAHANPRLAAREGIRARQVMIEGVERDSRLGQMSGAKLKEEINRVLREVGLGGRGVRSALPQRNKGMLIELENDSVAPWMNSTEKRVAFCEALGPGVVIKPRTHTLIAFNVPLTIDPDNREHMEEICEANHLEHKDIAAIRWVKPVA